MTAIFFSVFRRVSIGLLVLLLGCISDPPKGEYSLARSAIQAAKSAGAPKHAPGYWHKAKMSFRKAEKLFSEKEPGEAKELFIRARRYAERAETSARLSQAKGGDFE